VDNSVEDGQFSDSHGVGGGGVMKVVKKKELNEEEAKEKSERMMRLQEEIKNDDAKADEGSDMEEEDLTELSAEEQMRKLMGFGDFGTTKGKKVEDNHTGAARGATASKKERKYRQYMNRKGGFNRPLDKLE